MTGEHWDALAAALKARREALRLPQDLIDRGGPGEMTMRKLERAESTAIRNKTKTQIEYALSWRDGLVDKILDGSVTDAELSETVARAGAAQGSGVALGAHGRGTAVHNVAPTGIPSAEAFGTPHVARTSHGEPTIDYGAQAAEAASHVQRDPRDAALRAIEVAEIEVRALERAGEDPQTVRRAGSTLRSLWEEIADLRSFPRAWSPGSGDE